jgi:hypothetical protein
VVFLAEIFRFFLIQWVLVDHNLAMEFPWGIPTIPKVLFGSVKRIGRLGVGFGELTRGCCSSRAAQAWLVWPVLVTGLTGVCLLWDLPWVSCLTRVPLGLVGAGQFLASLEVFCLAFVDG